MIFADPKSDIGFKKLFCNQANKEILISFLNSILKRKKGELIIDITITDPSNFPERIEEKFSAVDGRCIDQKGHHYIIEMQVMNQKGYGERAQYYSSVAVARQLKAGQEYKDIVPVIFLGVVNFDLFESKNYLTHHYMRNDENNEIELGCLEFHFIELTKFKKNLGEISDVADKWAYLLKNAEDMYEIPEQFTSPEQLEEAMDVLMRSRWTVRERDAYDRELDEIRTRKSVLETAQEEGELKGIAIGEIKAKTEIAQELLSENMSIEKISRLTGLPLKVIEGLKNVKKT